MFILCLTLSFLGIFDVMPLSVYIVTLHDISRNVLMVLETRKVKAKKAKYLHSKRNPGMEELCVGI